MNGYLEYIHSGEQEREKAEMERLYKRPISRRLSFLEFVEKYFGKQKKCPCCGATREEGEER